MSQCTYCQKTFPGPLLKQCAGVVAPPQKINDNIGIQETGNPLYLITWQGCSLILLGAGIACVAVLYRIGSLAKETSRFSNLVFAVLSLGIIIGVDYALRAILGLLL